jgi:hypothetical protein
MSYSASRASRAAPSTAAIARSNGALVNPSPFTATREPRSLTRMLADRSASSPRLAKEAVSR